MNKTKLRVGDLVTVNEPGCKVWDGKIITIEGEDVTIKDVGISSAWTGCQFCHPASQVQKQEKGK